MGFFSDILNEDQPSRKSMMILLGGMVFVVLVMIALGYVGSKTGFTITITIVNKDKQYNKEENHDEHYTYFVTSSEGETFDVKSLKAGLGHQDMLLWNKFVVNSTYKVKGYGVKAESAGITRTITEIL